MEKIPVFLDLAARAESPPASLEGPSLLDEIVSGILDAFISGSPAGQTVLVKPNLLKAGEPLCATSPGMIMAICRQMLDRGARVTVADSPAFGNAEKVLCSLGILENLLKIGVHVCSLTRPVKVKLPCGIDAGISRKALDADLILNVPRLKAHCQMGVTCAVKNTFGTVTGFRKALSHTLYGRDPGLFAQMILEISQALPPMLSIVDALTIMHVTGPSGGRPFDLEIIAAGRNPVAVDTCMYRLLNLKPGNIPIWKQARRLGLKGAYMEEIAFTERKPGDFSLKGRVIMPERLEPVTFNPFRFLKGRAKSLLKRIF